MRNEEDTAAAGTAQFPVAAQPETAVSVIVPAEVQEALAAWLLGQGLDLYPVPPGQERELPAFQVAIRLGRAA